MTINGQFLLPVYSPKLWHQHIKISAKLHVMEAQERCLKSLKKWQLVKPDAAPRGDSSYIFYFKDQINTQNQQNTSNIEECIPPKRGKHCHKEPSAGLSQQLRRQFYCLSGKFNVLWPSLRELATTPPSVMSSVTSQQVLQSILSV